ncbi:Transposon Tf2-6 polyprotein [Euphorbia peplus]|nr:Transposon Tf2-6 polyprotein [Euphorbia peplus]
MPFGLKNAGATYQRLMDKMFTSLIGSKVHVYIDDMIVMSSSDEEHVSDLHQVFEIFGKFNLKLNPEKCFFGICSGKFLGYIISEKGLSPNPSKVETVMGMAPLISLHEVQCLNGRLIALGRFISCSAHCCIPFYKLMRKEHPFLWTDECQASFDAIKQLLISPPMMSVPKRGEDLFLYFTISDEAVALVLTRSEQSQVLPIYYLSKVLRGAEASYSRTEKALFAIVYATERLRPYFQAHTIYVVTEYSLGKVLAKCEVSKRVDDWAIRLSQFDVWFKPRTTIKAQALSDFLSEYTGSETLQDQSSKPIVHE